MEDSPKCLVRIRVWSLCSDVKIELEEHGATAVTSHSVGHVTVRVHTTLGQQKSVLLGVAEFCEPEQVRSFDSKCHVPAGLHDV